MPLLLDVGGRRRVRQLGVEAQHVRGRARRACRLLLEIQKFPHQESMIFTDKAVPHPKGKACNLTTYVNILLAMSHLQLPMSPNEGHSIHAIVWLHFLAFLCDILAVWITNSWFSLVIFLPPTLIVCDGQSMLWSGGLSSYLGRAWYLGESL